MTACGALARGALLIGVLSLGLEGVALALGLSHAFFGIEAVLGFGVYGALVGAAFAWRRLMRRPDDWYTEDADPDVLPDDTDDTDAARK